MSNRSFFISVILFFTVFVFGGCNKGFSQEKKIQLGLTSSFFPEGSDLSITYAHTIGLEINYFFKKKNKFSYFATSGLSKDLDGASSALTIIHLGLGAQYDLIHIWNKPFYLSISGGGLYLHEEFSIQLIEGSIQSTFNEFGFKASFGVGYYISKRFNVQINVNQLNDFGTSLQLGLYYNF